MKRALPTLAAIAATALFLWPARAGLLGDPFGETHNHLWFFAHAWAGLTANFPTGWSVPLMDPPNLPWFGLGWLVSPTVAWNLVAIANVLLAAWGGWQLGGQASGTRTGAWVGMGVVGFSPFLAGVVEFGVTEALPVGFYALHVASMLRLRERGGWPEAAWAGLTLALFALSGWYNAAFALVAALPLAIHVRRREALYAGGLAFLLVLPRFLQLLSYLSVWQDRAAGLSDPTPIRMWAAQERYGIDLLRFFPSTDTITPSYSVYLGGLALALAAIGGKRAWAFLALAAPLWLLALGHWLRVRGQPIELGSDPVLLPAGWLVAKFETARFITHWYRAAGPATVFLGAAAALGATALAARLSPRLPRAAAVLGPLAFALVLADGLVLSSTRWPRVAAPLPEAPFRPDGPVLDLPIDDNRTPPERHGTRRPYWMWQLSHGQPVAENYEAADRVLAQSGEARTLQLACGGLPRARPGAPDAGKIEAGSEEVTLRALGFRWLVLHKADAPAGCVTAVEQRFGPPNERNDRMAAWKLGG